MKVIICSLNYRSTERMKRLCINQIKCGKLHYSTQEKKNKDINKLINIHVHPLEESLLLRRQLLQI